MTKIKNVCQIRNDQWAHIVNGKIEYFSGDLHAANCVYHKSCNINFRNGKKIPQQYISDSTKHLFKDTILGRPQKSMQLNPVAKGGGGAWGGGGTCPPKLFYDMKVPP